MKKSTIEKRIAAHLTTKSGNVAVKFENVIELISNPETKLYLKSYSGSGRFTKVSNAKHHDTIRGLELIGIDYETGNDAPRGGATGDFICLTKKGKLQVKNFAASAKIQREQAAAEMAAAKLQAEAARKTRIAPIIDFLTENKEEFKNRVQKWEAKGKNTSNAERSAAWQLSGLDGQFSLKGESINDILDAWQIVKNN